MKDEKPIARLKRVGHAALEAQRGRMFYWLPVWLGVGILIYFAQGQEPPLWWASVLAAATALLGVAALFIPATRTAFVPLALMCAGFAAAQLDTSRKAPLADLPRRAALIEGTVQAVDLLPDGGRRLELSHVSIASNPPLRRLVHVTMNPGDPVTPDIGDQVRTRALLQNPEAPSWPGGRDPQFEAYFAGLAGSGKALELVEDLGGGAGQGWVAQMRETIAARVVAEIPGTEGEIAATLMAGATSSIPQADRSAFANSGLAHLLAVAGLHMATVMGVVFSAVRLGLVLVPRWGLVLPCKQIAAVAGLLAGLVYLMLTGNHVPTERSFAMAALVVLAVIFGRRVVSLRGLALAAMVVLLVAPDALAGVSFQMSFGAVFALIAGYRALGPWFARAEGWGGLHGWTGRHMLALAATSFLAGTASLPFAAAAFGQIQVYYILANLIAVPITVVIIMPMAVLALILMPLGAAHAPLWVMGKAIGAVLWIARAVSALPAAVVPWPPTPAWGLIAVALGMLWLGLMHGRLRLAGLAPLVAGLAAPFLAASPDFLVARDGRAVAWRTQAGVQLWQAKSGASYELEDWRKMWPRAQWTPMSCEGGICHLLAGQVSVVTKASAADCTAKLILASVSLRDACPDVPTIDRSSLYDNGAYAGVWNNGKPVITSDRSLRGNRPWVPPSDQIAITSLPTAQSE